MVKSLIKYTIMLVFLCFPYKVVASYEFSKGCEMALFEILNLNLQKAKEILVKERIKYPDNYFIDYLENYRDIVELLVLEDKKSYNNFLKRFNNRLDKMEESNTATPYYRAVRAEMMAQTGLANVMNGDEISGFIKIFKANKLLKKNFNEFPDFYLNKKLYGVFNVAFDNMPLSVKWATRLLGLIGDTDNGFTYLKTYKEEVKGRPGLYSESLIYQIFAFSIISDYESAYEMLKRDYTSFVGTTLGTYLYAVVLYRINKNEESLDILYSLNIDDMDIEFNPVIQLIAREKLNRLDSDADLYWLRYLKNSKNENHKKEACNKLSYYYLINNNEEKFYYFRNMINTYDKAIMREDREADIDANRTLPINVDLLKARFLVSGSYFERADLILEQFNANKETNLPNKIQYYLLKGKILSNRGTYTEAMVMFNQAIDQGKNISESYAAEAAFMAGTLAYDHGYHDKAYDYYKLCQSIDCDNNIYREVIQKNVKKQLKKLKKLNTKN